MYIDSTCTEGHAGDQPVTSLLGKHVKPRGQQLREISHKIYKSWDL